MRRNCLIISIVCLSVWLIGGCTVFAPQTTLRKELKEYRELVVRLDGVVLNPEAAAEIPVYSESGEPVDAEVDVRVPVMGTLTFAASGNSVASATGVFSFYVLKV